MADKQGELQEALDVLDQARTFLLDPRAVVTGSSVDEGKNQVGGCVGGWMRAGAWTEHAERIRFARWGASPTPDTDKKRPHHTTPHHTPHDTGDPAMAAVGHVAFPVPPPSARRRLVDVHVGAHRHAR
jgi:hypothetical protein